MFKPQLHGKVKAMKNKYFHMLYFFNCYPTIVGVFGEHLISL